MGDSGGSVDLVAYCGLYCGNCSGHKKRRWGSSCPGCLENGGLSSCRLRQCCTTMGYRTCAECDSMPGCALFDSLTHRLSRLVFRSDKRGNLAQIRSMGIHAFVLDRMESGKT